MPTDLPLVADAQAEYGLSPNQRIGLRLRHERQRSRPRLVTLTHQLTTLDQEFITFGAKNQGISKSEFLRRLIAMERLAWQRDGLFQPGRGE